MGLLEGSHHEKGLVFVPLFQIIETGIHRPGGMVKLLGKLGNLRNVVHFTFDALVIVDMTKTVRFGVLIEVILTNVTILIANLSFVESPFGAQSRFKGEMHFTCSESLVALFREELHKTFSALGHFVVFHHSRTVGHLTGVHGIPGWYADRAGSVSSVKGDAVFDEFVQHRSLYYPISQGFYGVEALLISKDK
jgi:hypothetical protein